MQLEGKVAVVTGAGSGIGRAIALGLAAEGARVVVSDIAADRAGQVAKEIGEQAIAVAADVSRTADVEALFEAAVKRFGQLDVLVNNAGRAIRAPAAEMTDEQWDEVIAVNLRGTFLCSRAAVRLMVPRRTGSIVNTASGLGIRGSPGAAVYGASKAAIINFTRSLALEVASHGINVNAFSPGVTDTPLWRAARSQADVDEALRAGRVGRPEDLVPTVVFLCSKGGRALTGITIDREIFVAKRE
jgi:3-oxoacyl-[acyl-carrier protein] reductase